MAKLTKEMVFAAADKLDAQGVKPTAIRIREEVGRGSYSYISAWLAEWEGPQSAADDETPDAPEAVETLWPHIWKTCYAAAAEMLARRIEKAEEETKQLRADLDRASRAVDQAEEERERLESALESAEAKTREQEREIARLGGMVEALREKPEIPPEKPATAKPEKEDGGGSESGKKGQKSKPTADKAGTGRGRGKPAAPPTADELEKLGQTRIDDEAPKPHGADI